MKHKLPASSTSSAPDARIVKTDLALRRAMLELLESKPLEQITIRDIAAKAGIHYTTFFRHHPTKESLLNSVAADQIERLVELSVPVHDAVNTHAAYVAICAYVSEHRPLWTALLTGGAAGTMREELLRVARTLAQGRERRFNTIPVELSVICSVSIIVETLSWWLKQEEADISVEEIAEMLNCLSPGPDSSPKEFSAARVSRPRQR